MKTGNTAARKSTCSAVGMPQWSPVMKTGNTRMPALRQAMAAGLNGARS